MKIKVTYEIQVPSEDYVEVRDVLLKEQEEMKMVPWRLNGKSYVCFINEIHTFNKNGLTMISSCGERIDHSNDVEDIL